MFCLILKLFALGVFDMVLGTFDAKTETTVQDKMNTNTCNRSIVI